MFVPFTAGPCVPDDPCQGGAECLTIDEGNYVCRCLANGTGSNCEIGRSLINESFQLKVISMFMI